MTPEQFSQLLTLLEKLASRQYTIAGAADWPILATVGGALVGLLGFMWLDLRSVMRDNKSEWREALDKHAAENVRDIDKLWDAHRDCQLDCCPRREKP